MKKNFSLVFILIGFFNTFSLAQTSTGEMGFYADGLKVDTVGCLNFKNSFIVLKTPPSKYVKYFIMVKNGVYQLKGSNVLLWNNDYPRSKLDKYQVNGYYVLPFSADNITDGVGANNLFQVGKGNLVLFTSTFGLGGMALKKQMKSDRSQVFDGYFGVDIYGSYIVKYEKQYNSATSKVEDVPIYVEDHIAGMLLHCKKRYTTGNFEDTAGYNLMNCKIRGKANNVANMIWKNGNVNFSPGNNSGGNSSDESSKDISHLMSKPDASGKLIPYIEKHDNGKIAIEGATINGVHTGVWKQYSYEGVLTEVKEYGSTPRDKKVTQYYKNGKISVVENYKNTDRDGVQLTYFNDGKLQSSEMFVNGKREGEEIKILPTGEKTTTMYKNNTKTGPYKEFDKNGKPVEEGSYNDGQKDGTWKYYEKGILTKTEKYNKGQLIQ